MSSSEPAERDLVVVGAGPGGYVAAIRAAQHGRDVTLVDREAPGGTCLNHGCIPSKALIEGADAVHGLGANEFRGIYADPFVDTEDLAAWRDDVVDRLVTGVEQLCDRHDIELLAGEAAFLDDRTLRLSGDGPDRIRFADAVVATGSRPVELDALPFDAEGVLDSRAVLELETPPSRLVVVGAGYIGMELSTAFAKLGSDVTVLEALDRPLPRYPADLVDPVERRAAELGVDIHTDHRVEDLSRTDDGRRVHATVDGEGRTYDGDAVLVAVGREPVTDSLDLGRAGVETTPDGFVQVDDAGRTTAEKVAAIGDVTGEPMLAHAASAEATAAVAAMEGSEAAVGPVPEVVFTDPEVATVGLTAAAAREAGHDVVTGECGFGSNGRALTRDADEGFVRVVAAADGTLLGAAVVGPEASELVAVPSVVLSMDGTLEDLAGAVYAHPTLSEAVGEAAESALGRAVHTN